MIVSSVLLDKKRYKLIDEGYCSQNNAFTIIVGSNGMGKSRLLKRIVNNLKNVCTEDRRIPANYSRHLDIDIDGYNTSIYATTSESKSFISQDKHNIDTLGSDVRVLAVTTTPFDKFPVEYKGNKTYRYHDENKYTYIGLKVSANALNQSNYINLLARSMLKSDQIFKNLKLFSLLNLSPGTEIQFKTKLPVKFFELKSYNYKLKKYEYFDLDEDSFTKAIFRYHISIYEKLKSTKNGISKAYIAFAECRNYLQNPINPENESIPALALIYLLDVGLINASDIIFSNSAHAPIRISDLSSGQKCMILTLLNISGSITDNSVVCIDEPEISLHPKWQKEFMKILIEFFSNYKRCHFIIATHSPLIISELSKSNCFILNMDVGFAKKASEYKMMSSDYQLAEVFGIAGNNNEYLNRMVVSLLSKLSSHGTLEKSDKIKMSELTVLSQDMNEDDHVKELIDILNLAWRKVAKNAK